MVYNECIKRIARIREACNNVLIVDVASQDAHVASQDARNLAIKILKMIREEKKRE